MSHIVEEYAKNLGVYVGRPIVQKHFFPTPREKYITINGDHQIQSKTYPYLFMVVKLLREGLGNANVKIIQVGGGDKPIRGVDTVMDKLTFKQYAYVLSKSILHIGPDNIFMHYASSCNVPLVTLFGNVYSSVTNGYWTKPNMKRDIEAPWAVKPSMSLEDPDRTITKIKPEEIAEHCLDLLGIKTKPKFETKHIGAAFTQNMVEVIPQQYVNLPLFQNKMLVLRTDLGGTSEALLSYCFNHRVELVLDKAVMPLETIQSFSQNVVSMSIFVDKEMDPIPEEYLQACVRMGINIHILTKNKDELNDLRAQYFDFNVNLFDPPQERPDHISEDAQFLSNKWVVEGENVYPSKAHWQVYEKCLDKPANIIDNPLYWEDLEHFYIYERK